ncbi:DWNN domain, partial [Striga asiatica]
CLLLVFAPNEKCRLKNGFLVEPEPILSPLPSGPPPPLMDRSNTISPLKSLLTTRFLDFLRALESVSPLIAFSDNIIFTARFSPNVQTGQVGSYLSISKVIYSKHSEWYTCPHVRTETTASSFTAYISFCPNEDPSVKSRVQIPQLEWGLLNLVNLSLLGPDASLSKDHLSRAAGIDQLSEDPPLESFPQEGAAWRDEGGSSDIEKEGDLGILLCWCHLKGVENEGDADLDEREGTEGESFRDDTGTDFPLGIHFLVQSKT